MSTPKRLIQRQLHNHRDCRACWFKLYYVVSEDELFSCLGSSKWMLPIKGLSLSHGLVYANLNFINGPFMCSCMDRHGPLISKWMGTNQKVHLSAPPKPFCNFLYVLKVGFYNDVHLSAGVCMCVYHCVSMSVVCCVATFLVCVCILFKLNFPNRET